MNWRFAALTLALAVGHYLLAMFLILALWGGGMSGLEGSAAVTESASTGSEAIEGVCAVLTYPAVALWTPWMSKHMPNFVEVGLFCANSLLWGVAAAYLLRGAYRIAARRRLDS